MVARRIALAIFSRVRGGRLELVEPDGTRHLFGPPDGDLRATITIHDPAFWRACLRGSVGLGELYAAGGWDCDDLVALTRIGARDISRADRLRRPVATLQHIWTQVPRNTREGARKHIAAHYDLGNELFELFLDETMTYSCALFEEPGMSLHEAQLAKLDRICQRLELKPDDHLVEIGTGWGSLALHAAREYGCRVTTTTLSREQATVAIERATTAGLSDRIQVLTSDYRDLQGRYDKLVSIEMIEAVGWQYFDEYFACCSRLLGPDGLMFLQAITVDDRAYEVEKASRSFANTFIFPGGCLPAVSTIADCVARKTNFRVLRLDDITDSYPLTLAAWRERFVAATDQLEALGYDERFRRMWELYLTLSEGGFRERRIRDVQVLLAKPEYEPSQAVSVDAAAQPA